MVAFANGLVPPLQEKSPTTEELRSPLRESAFGADLRGEGLLELAANRPKPSQRGLKLEVDPDKNEKELREWYKGAPVPTQLFQQQLSEGRDLVKSINTELGGISIYTFGQSPQLTTKDVIGKVLANRGIVNDSITRKLTEIFERPATTAEQIKQQQEEAVFLTGLAFDPRTANPMRPFPLDEQQKFGLRAIEELENAIKTEAARPDKQLDATLPRALGGGVYTFTERYFEQGIQQAIYGEMGTDANMREIAKQWDDSKHSLEGHLKERIRLQNFRL